MTDFSTFAGPVSTTTLPTPEPAAALQSTNLYILPPIWVFAAQLNMPTTTDVVDTLIYDNVGFGAFSDINIGNTVLLGSALGLGDYGRQYIRKGPDATHIYVGRSSTGTHDGELTIIDNAYITVIDDHNIWAKISYIKEITDTDVEILKESDIQVGTFTTTPPPVANTGPGTAQYLPEGEDHITVTLPIPGVISFPIADDATIVSYVWDAGDGTYIEGTNNTSSVIQVTFPAGFRWVTLTVTDSNGKQHTAHCPVLAVDPDSDVTIDNWEIDGQTITEQGQQITLRIMTDIPEFTYPDGSLVMIWDREPYSPVDRGHMLVIGRMGILQSQVKMEQTGLLRTTTLTVTDGSGKLDLVPGFPIKVSNDNQRIIAQQPVITWSYMVNPTIFKYWHYLLHWHSNFLDVYDWILPNVSDDYKFIILGSDGESILDQMSRRVKALVPNYMLTFNRVGQMSMIVDPQTQNFADRTTEVQVDITENDYSEVRFTVQRAPRVNWLRGKAIKAGYGEIEALFSNAPGSTPGQGVQPQDQSEQLAISQEDLNDVTGHQYARINAPESTFDITLVQNDDVDALDRPWREIEPAALTWITFSMSVEISPQRQLILDQARGLARKLEIKYQNSKTGRVRTVQLTWERETVGVPGTTYIPPAVVPTDPPTIWPVPPPEPFVPPDFGPPEYSGNVKAYLAWNGTDMFRTWDLLEEPPTWELVNIGITGFIKDCQYAQIDADHVGAWLLTTDGIFWCNDLMAATPTWNLQLSNAYVQTQDAIPEVGTVEICTMYNYAGTEPGYLVCATGIEGAALTDNLTYAHSYYWHTHDFGVTWTQIDNNGDLENDDQSGWCYVCGTFGMNMFRSAPGTIYCVRASVRTGVGVPIAIFTSVDGGHTWSKTATHPGSGFNNQRSGSVLNPYPSLGDPSYIVKGDIGVSSRLELYQSFDEWATMATLTPNIPAGYGGFSGTWRVNKRTFDNDHILAWMRHSATDHMHLMESNDQGATWHLLWDASVEVPYVGEDSIAHVIDGGVSSQIATPNGWPPNVDVWMMIRSMVNGDIEDSPDTHFVMYTDNNFLTQPLDKTGNLRTLLTVWGEGPANGFALPRLGPNANTGDPLSGIVVLQEWTETDLEAGPYDLTLSNALVAGDVIAWAWVGDVADFIPDPSIANPTFAEIDIQASGLPDNTVGGGAIKFSAGDGTTLIEADTEGTIFGLYVVHLRGVRTATPQGDNDLASTTATTNGVDIEATPSVTVIGAGDFAFWAGMSGSNGDTTLAADTSFDQPPGTLILADTRWAIGYLHGDGFVTGSDPTTLTVTGAALPEMDGVNVQVVLVSLRD